MPKARFTISPSFADFREMVPLLSAINVTCKRQLSRPMLQMYNIAAATRKWASYEQWALYKHAQNKSLRKRVKEAEKFETCLRRIESHVNPTAFKFIKLQLQQQRKKPRGRRFPVDDKIFALSLLKQSPKA